MKRTWFCNVAVEYNETAMFQDQYVFSQLTSFLNRTQFNNYVRKYDGNRYVKHLTCWNQMLAMMFGQLSNRESLRDSIDCCSWSTSSQTISSRIRSWTYSQNDSCDCQSEPRLQDLRGLCLLHDEGGLREAGDQHSRHSRKEVRLRLNYNSVVSSYFPLGQVPEKEGRSQSSCPIWHWSSGSSLLYCNCCIEAWFYGNVFNSLWTKCLLHIRQGLWLIQGTL